MWQYCDQWHGVWKRGEKVSCRILHPRPREGGLLLGHRQTVGDPFLKHTPGVGSGYPATVRRSSDERRRPARGHRDRSHDLQGRHETFFFTGVGQFIPQPGTTISEVTVVRIENPGDPKRRHPFVRVTPALTHNDPWITNCITRIPFSAATSPPSDGPPKCRPPTSGGRRKNPLTREAYERLSSIYYESFIDSLMQVDGQTSGGGLCRHGAPDPGNRPALHAAPPKAPRRGIRLQTVPVPPLLLPLRHLPFSPWRSPKSLKRRSTR